MIGDLYFTKYRMVFENAENEEYELRIQKYQYIGPVYDIVGTVDAVIHRSVSADDDKFSPVLGQELVAKLLVNDDNPLTIDDLTSESENEIVISLAYTRLKDQLVVFQGFGVVEDSVEPFTDGPRVISVRAVDGLGLLKGKDFADDNGLIYTGVYSVIWWITQILQKTNQLFDIRSYFNFAPADSPNVDCLNSVYLDARTFYQGAGLQSTPQDPTVDVIANAAVDCATALQMIMTCFRCRVFQQNGYWHVVSVQEMCDFKGMAYEQYHPTSNLGTYDAVLVSRGTSQIYDITIGKEEEEVTHFVNADAQRTVKLSTKYIKLDYNYNQSTNKICNQDLSQGDADPADNETINSLVIDKTYVPSRPMQTVAYEPFCFTGYDGASSSLRNLYPDPTAHAGKLFIRSVLDDYSNELVRFLVLGSTTKPSSTAFIQTTDILIDTSDIFQLTFSWRIRTPLAIHSGIPIATVYLFGDDGNFYALTCADDNNVYNSDPGHNAVFRTQWRQTSNSFRAQLNPDDNTSATGNIVVATGDLTSIDLTEWQSVSVNTQKPQVNGIPPILARAPVSGRIVICLTLPVLVTQPEIWFKDISVTIIPYLVGSYRQIKGDFNYWLNGQQVSSVHQEDITISDSPKRYFQGALLHSDGSLQPPTWVRKKYPQEQPLRFTGLMAKTLFNQLCRQYERIEGTIRGLIYKSINNNDFDDEYMEGFLNGYYFSNHPVPTRKFILTSFENDISAGTGRRVFIEILKDANDDGWKDCDNPIFERFKYLFA